MIDVIFDGICLNSCGIGVGNRNILCELNNTKKYNIYFNNSFEKNKDHRNILDQEQFKKIKSLTYNYVSNTAPVILSYPLGQNLFSNNLLPEYIDRYKIFHTITEVNKLNDACIKEMVYADEIWVPSHFDEKKFKEINENTHIITLGYDPLKYNKFIGGNDNIKKLCRDFVFLFSGTGLYRKGFKEIIEAYNRAFTDKDNVTLILMTNESTNEKFTNYIELSKLTNGPHMIMLDKYFHEDEIPSIYACADVLCLPSRAEGWALPATEFSGMGKPTIITNYGGQLEFLDLQGSWLIDPDGFTKDPLMQQLYNTEQYKDVYFPILGNKFIDNFSLAMREAFDNRTLTINKGNYIEEKVSKQFNWGNTRKLIEDRLIDINKKIKNGFGKTKDKKVKNIVKFNEFKKLVDTNKIDYEKIETNEFKKQMDIDKFSYVIAMTVCNRSELGGETLLELTMNSLIKSGLFESKINFKILLHDTGSDDTSYLEKYENIPNIIIKKCPVRTIQRINAYNMLKYIEEQLKCDYVICIEDDILFSKNWIENIDGWIKKYKKSTDILFTFYCSYEVQKKYFEDEYETWNTYNIDNFYGTQCYVFQYNRINELSKIYYDSDLTKNEYVGMLLQKWVKKYSIKSYIKACVPCIVQHINRGTSLKSVSHTSFTFLGEDSDPKFYDNSGINNNN